MLKINVFHANLKRYQVMFRNFTMLPKLYFALIFSFLFISEIRAEQILVTCGASEGHDFWVKSEIIPNHGWKRASIPNGRISLLKRQSDWDVIFVDASGKQKSATGQNALVVPVEVRDGHVTLVLIYAGAGTEVYSFNFDSNGQGELVWTKIRHHPIFRNAGVYFSKCT